MTDIAVQDRSVLATTVRLAAEGDEAAFTRLVSEHRAAMAGWRSSSAVIPRRPATPCRTRGRSPGAGCTRCATRTRSAPGCIAIAANEARQTIRAQRRRPVIDISETVCRTPAAIPADTIGLVDLQRALAHLNPDDRRLLALRYVAGLDSTEIARHTGAVGLRRP